MEELLLKMVLKAFAILAEAAPIHLLRAWLVQPGARRGADPARRVAGLGA